MEDPQDVRASFGSFVVGLYSCYSHKVKCTIISKYMLTYDMYGERRESVEPFSSVREV